MGSRVYSTYVTASTTLVTTAETVVATVSGVSMNKPGQSVSLRGWVDVTTGANTTDIVLRVREDSITGAVIGDLSDGGIYAAVGAGESRSIDAEHNPSGEIGGKTYVLTVVQTAASANGAATTAYIEARVSPV